MLTSLFGDVGPTTRPDRLGAPDAQTASDFGALGAVRTTLIETLVAEADSAAPVNERHVRELTIAGPPAEAMRAHFAAAGSVLRSSSRMLTLLDPGALWASSVVKAVSASSGTPMERLQLRERHSQRSLATIERTPSVRVDGAPLRVWHAQAHQGGDDIAELQIALMERSDLTAVFIGLMEPAEIDALLDALRRAAHLPTWRCPTLLLLLPPNAVWIANKADAQHWPGWISMVMVGVPLTSASEVWTTLADVWRNVERAHATPPAGSLAGSATGSAAGSAAGLAFGLAGATGSAGSATSPASAPPANMANTARSSGHGGLANAANPGSGTTAVTAVATSVALGATPVVVRHSQAGGLAPASPKPPTGERPPQELHPMLARRAVADIMTLDGLLCCAVVDGTTGKVLARETREDHPIDLDVAAAAAARLRWLQAEASQNLGLGLAVGETPDDVVIAAPLRYHLTRSIANHPGLFLLALLDRHRANLASARLRLQEVERGLR